MDEHRDGAVEGVDAALDRVVEVQLCDDTGCSTPKGTTAPDEPPYYVAYPSGAGSWMVDVLMSAPGTADVRAFDAEGVVLGEVSTTLTWVRVGGSAECGGPMQTDPVVLPVAVPA